MKIGFISTRLAGYDGVSLETDKWAVVSKRLGHEIFYCAGELGKNSPPGMLIPEMHFATEENMWICKHAYGQNCGHSDLFSRIATQKLLIKNKLLQFIHHHRLDLLVLQNVLAVPLQIPLALALQDVIAETALATIAHNHDFYWERTCYHPTAVQEILDAVFPIDLPSIVHVTINSIAQKSLQKRRSIKSYIVPNVFDFATPAPGIDDYNCDLRAQIGVGTDELLILAPVRIIPRKGLELGVDVLAGLPDMPCCYVLSHSEDLDRAYLDKISDQARKNKVKLLFLGKRLGNSRSMQSGAKSYLLWDVYPHADFVFYPSLYEGFGNALLEAIYFRKPVLINRYPVYREDIKPLGFDFVEIDSLVDDTARDQVRHLLTNLDACRRIVNHNYRLAQEHFSYEALQNMLDDLLRFAFRG